jgi:hypothetical protein
MNPEEIDEGLLELIFFVLDYGIKCVRDRRGYGFCAPLLVTPSVRVTPLSSSRFYGPPVPMGASVCNSGDNSYRSRADNEGPSVRGAAGPSTTGSLLRLSYRRECVHS